MATNPKSGAKPADPAAAPQNSKKKMFIIIGVVAAVAIAGVVGWMLTKGKSGNDGHHEEAHAAPPRPPVFQPIEPFTVNLKNDGEERFMQLGLTLKYFAPELEPKLKLNMPEIRSKILQLLTTKTARELLSPDGKNKLAKDIVFISNSVLGTLEPVAPPVMMVPAASQPAATAEHSSDAASLVAAVPVAPPPPKPISERKGVVDALFTSFIIQ